MTINRVSPPKAAATVNNFLDSLDRCRAIVFKPGPAIHILRSAIQKQNYD
jgi:hypothetical protein